jgi:GMP synthase-like glutamine amidotransferase
MTAGLGAGSPAGPGAERLVVVEHDADAPAGLLESWAGARGMAVTTVRLHAGDPLPAAGDFGAAVLLGSEQTAYDDGVPWLGRELSFTEDLLAAPVPVLGICFGGQVLARVLGAPLYRLPEPEIGWVRVASHRPGLAAGPWLSWHRDAFGLPDGAVELAGGERCLQAFGYGPHAGVQFHPEATEPIVREWHRLAGPEPAGERGTRLFGQGPGPWRRAAESAGALFSGWLDGTLVSGPAAA